MQQQIKWHRLRGGGSKLNSCLNKKHLSIHRNTLLQKWIDGN